MIIDSLGSPKAIIESRARAWSDTVKERIKLRGYKWVLDLEDQELKSQTPKMYHGTHLSNLTSIRYDGLRPFKESGKEDASIFVVTNPASAVYHVTQGGQYDTFLSDPTKPNIQPMDKLISDPFILLEIDFEKLSLAGKLSALKIEQLQQSYKYSVQANRAGLLDQDSVGIPLDFEIPEEYIRAVICDKDGKIHKLKFDDLVDNVVLENKLGIVPDFMN